MKDSIALLRRYGIRPTLQRLAVAEYILNAKIHPSAEQVLQNIRRRYPTISRASVYNALNLFTQKGLIRMQVLREGMVVFDANVRRHHHFIDEESGKIYDIPWEAIKVEGGDRLKGFEVHELQVIIRGRKIKR